MIIYSGDNFTVARDRLVAISEGLDRLDRDLGAVAWVPAGSADTLNAVGIGAAGFQAEALRFAVQLASGTAFTLGEKLAQAQDLYEGAESVALGAIESVSDTVVAAVTVALADLAVLGVAGSVAVLATPHGMLAALGVVASGAALQGMGLLPSNGEISAWANGQLDSVLAHPVTPLILRMLVSGTDEMVNTFATRAGLVLGGPLGGIIAGNLPPRSPEDVAAVIAAGIDAKDGASKFDIESSAIDRSTPPNSMHELLTSIPPTRDGEPQVSIIEYLREDGSTVYLVGIAGTSSMAVRGGINAFDNRGNVGSFSSLENAESAQATMLAMERAGIEYGDEVVFAGYSQGALVAVELAKSGKWDTQSMMLAGTPVHGNEVGGKVPIVQLEHPNDFITTFDGLPRNPHGDVAVVERTPEASPSLADPLAPHAFTEYERTASEYDAMSGGAHDAHREQVLAPLAGATAVVATEYHITRHDPASIAAGEAIYEAIREAATPPNAPQFVTPVEPPRVLTPNITFPGGDPGQAAPWHPIDFNDPGTFVPPPGVAAQP